MNLNIPDTLQKSITYLDRLEEAILLLAEIDSRVVDLQHQYEDASGTSIGIRIRKFLDGIRHELT